MRRTPTRARVLSEVAITALHGMQCEGTLYPGIDKSDPCVCGVDNGQVCQGTGCDGKYDKLYGDRM